MNRQPRLGLPVLILIELPNFWLGLFEHKTQGVFDQFVGRLGRIEFR
jgi:hypothetical protein